MLTARGMKWRDAVLDNGMRVQYKHDQDAQGVNVLYRGFWLHLRALDWAEVQAHLEKEFGRVKLLRDVVVFTEPDGTPHIGMNSKVYSV